MRVGDEHSPRRPVVLQCLPVAVYAHRQEAARELRISTIGYHYGDLPLDDAGVAEPGEHVASDQSVVLPRALTHVAQGAGATAVFAASIASLCKRSATLMAGFWDAAHFFSKIFHAHMCPAPLRRLVRVRPGIPSANPEALMPWSGVVEVKKAVS